MDIAAKFKPEIFFAVIIPILEFVVALPYLAINYLAICSIKSKRIGAN